MVYRFYVDMQDPTDRMSSVFGNDQASLLVNTPDGAFNSAFNSSWNASGINPAFVAVFPDLADDTYATIGLTGPASTSGIAGAADPSIVEDAVQPVTPYFLTPGATSLAATTLTGSSWYVLNTAANSLPDANLQVLIMQVTTTGSISGQINFQVFPLGVGADQEQISIAFDGTGTFSGYSVIPVEGCMVVEVCNYNPLATVDDGSCEFALDNFDCNGNCIVAFDCAGECGGDAVADALGECGGSCDSDANGDGVCDDAVFISVELDTAFYGVNTPTPEDDFDVEGILEGYKSFIVYANFNDPTHVLSALFADVDAFPQFGAMGIDAPCGCFNISDLNMVMDATNSSVLWGFPAGQLYEYDTFWTIGMLSGDAPGQLPGFISTPPVNGTEICDSPLANGLVFITGSEGNWPVNAVAGDDLKVEIARVTTCADWSMNVSLQVFLGGSLENVAYSDYDILVDFNGFNEGCTDPVACNYDANAEFLDDSCDYLSCGDALTPCRLQLPSFRH